MPENYGGLKNAYFLIGRETTWGTPVAPAKDVGIVTDKNWGASNEIIKSRGMSSRSLDQIQIGAFRFKGDLTCEYQHGRLLEYAFGTVGHSGTADPITHTFTEADTIPSFTAEVGLDGTVDDVERYAGCKINSLTLAQDLGGVMTMRIEALCKTLASTTTATTAVTDTGPTFSFAHTTFKVGAAGAEAEVAQCRSWEWTMTNGIDGDNDSRGMGDYLSKGFIEGERNYTARVTLAFTGITERARFLAGTAAATAPATADFDGFSTVIAVAKGTNDTMTLTLSDCHYSEYGRPIAVGGQILQDFSIEHATAGIVTKDAITSANWG